MDRFTRHGFAFGLVLCLGATGCRSTQQEVPPGRSMVKDNKSRPAIQFSSAGHPTPVQASAPTMPNNLGGSDIASGINGGARPEGSPYAGIPGAFGPLGTAGGPAPPSDPATVRASGSTTPSGPIPLTGTPPPGVSTINLPPLGSAPSEMAPPSLIAPDLNVPSPRDSTPPPNPLAQPPLENPAATAAPSPMPNPM